MRYSRDEVRDYATVLEGLARRIGAAIGGSLDMSAPGGVASPQLE